MNFTSMDESRSSENAKKRVRLLKPRQSSKLFTDSDDSDRATFKTEEEGGCERVESGPLLRQGHVPSQSGNTACSSIDVPRQSSKLFTDSDDSDRASFKTEEEGGCERVESRPLLRQGHAPSQSGNTACSSIDVPHSPCSSSSSAEDDGQITSDLQTPQEPTTLQWTLPSCPQERVVHTFTGGPCGRKDVEAPHITESSTPLSVFLLYFAEIISLLVVETNRYYHQYLDTLDQGPSPVPDITEAEMFVFLAVTLQMGHSLRVRLADYWSTAENYYTPFYSSTMKRDRYWHILRFLHFTDNRNDTHNTDKNFGRMWKMRNVFEIINRTFSKFYNPTEHLAVDEVVVLFQGRVVFKHCVPKKREGFGMKIYKLCDSNGYTYDLKVDFGNGRQSAAQRLTAAHAIVTELTRKVEGRGHKLYVNSFFSSPALFDDLTKKKINCCGTVKPNRSGMPHDLESEEMRLKRGDVKVRTRGDLTAILWRYRKDVHMLTNIHAAPAEGNFRNEGGKAVTPHIVADYKHHMRCLRKGKWKANNYTISRPTWKWTKKLFFHLLDLAILNSYILLSSCGGKQISHRRFRIALIMGMLAHAGQVRQLQRPMGRPTGTDMRVNRLDECGSEHWPVPSKTQLRCRVCSIRGLTQKVFVKCFKCDVGLCVKKSCFKVYHTEEQL